jgi:hypothetical protein
LEAVQKIIDEEIKLVQEETEQIGKEMEFVEE